MALDSRLKKPSGASGGRITTPSEQIFVVPSGSRPAIKNLLSGPHGALRAAARLRISDSEKLCAAPPLAHLD